MGKFDFISIEEARKLSQEREFIVVDLRNPTEYYKSHIENAINLPSADIQKF